MSARPFDIKLTKKQSNIKVDHVVDQSGRVLVYHVRLHNNLVIKISNDGITLDSCGHLTPTTKTAINRALDQIGVSFRVIQNKGDWIVINYMTLDSLPFTDGMTITNPADIAC